MEEENTLHLFLWETTRLNRPHSFSLLPRLRFNNYLICSVEMLTDCVIVVNGNLQFAEAF